MEEKKSLKGRWRKEEERGGGEMRRRKSCEKNDLPFADEVGSTITKRKRRIMENIYDPSHFDLLVLLHVLHFLEKAGRYEQVVS